MTNSIVTVTVGNDPTVLGSDATLEDLHAWADNVCDAIRELFEVTVHVEHSRSSESLTCHVPEIREWLSEICQTDAWMQYL